MSKLLVAVECDYAGYEPFTTRCCRYDHSDSLENVQLALDVVASECGGKAVFLIHTSPFIRRNWNDAFFTSPDYLSMWREVVSQGGELGLHLHEEEPDGSCLYYGYSLHLERIVSEHVHLLAEAGLQPTCESTGYFGLNEWLVPILEQNRLLVNLDHVGKFTDFTGTDWTTAPLRPYFLDRNSVTCEGDSSVLVIPLGMTNRWRGEDGLMANHNSLRYLRSLWREMKKSQSPPGISFVWVEAHRMRQDEGKLRALLRFFRSEGAEFVVPSEAYRECTDTDLD